MLIALLRTVSAAGARRRLQNSSNTLYEQGQHLAVVEQISRGLCRADLAAFLNPVFLAVSGKWHRSVFYSSIFYPDPNGLDFFIAEGFLAVRHGDCQLVFT